MSFKGLEERTIRSLYCPLWAALEEVIPLGIVVDGSALGYYHPESGTIVVSDPGDRDTITHEVGHFVHFQMGAKYLLRCGVRPDFTYGDMREKEGTGNCVLEAWAEGFSEWAENQPDHVIVSMVEEAASLPLKDPPNPAGQILAEAWWWISEYPLF